MKAGVDVWPKLRPADVWPKGEEVLEVPPKGDAGCRPPPPNIGLEDWPKGCAEEPALGLPLQPACK